MSISVQFLSDNALRKKINNNLILHRYHCEIVSIKDSRQYLKFQVYGFCGSLDYKSVRLFGSEGAKTRSLNK